MKKFFILIFFSIPQIYAQTPSIVWDKTIGGSENDIAADMIQTSDGGFVIIGTSSSLSTTQKSEDSKGGNDLWVVKINESGVILWDKTLGGSGSDIASGIIETLDGSLVIVGNSASPISEDKSENNIGGGGHDYWIVKLTSTGQKLWDKTFGSYDDDISTSIIETDDGGFVVGGYTWGMGNSGDRSGYGRGGYDFWIVKMTSNGQKLWEKSIAGRGHEKSPILKKTVDGGLIIFGSSGSSLEFDLTDKNNGRSDYWMIKLNSNGQILWDKSIGGSWEDNLQSVTVTTDNGYILAGISSSPKSFDKSEDFKNYYGYDFWIVKVNGSGNKVWDRTIGGTSYEENCTAAIDTEGNVIIVGSTLSGVSGDKTENSKGGYDYWVVKLNSLGQKMWDKTIGGISVDKAKSIAITSSGDIVLLGTSSSDISEDKSENSKGNEDYWIVKLSDTPLSSTAPTIYYSEAPETIQQGTPLKVNFKAKTKN